ncbi:MAG: hypothetical protein AB7K71_37045 [Polyangiaceae bacterium]
MDSISGLRSSTALTSDFRLRFGAFRSLAVSADARAGLTPELVEKRAGDWARWLLAQPDARTAHASARHTRAVWVGLNSIIGSRGDERPPHGKGSKTLG